MNVKTVSPVEARDRVQQGARLFDIREPADYAREHIPSAISLPLSELDKTNGAGELGAQDTVIFHCQTGMRTSGNAERLAKAAAPATAYLLAGGINAWKQAGLDVILDRRQPLPLMRQVQIAAGSLVMLGVILGYSVTQGFFVLSGLVGAGLLFAGLSGRCGMAALLMKMPWNGPHQ